VPDSNSLDYYTVPTLTQVLTGNFLLLLLDFGCIADQRSIAFGYLIHLLVQRHLGSLLFFGDSSVSTSDAEGPGGCGSGVFIAEEVDGVGDERSGCH